MKKKIAISLMASFCFAGVVHAAGMWGTYKGNDIIKLTVDGADVKVADVPAVILNGRTMVPIYLLSQAGVTYSYDAKKQTVDVKKSKSGGSQSGSSLKTIKEVTKLGGNGVTLFEQDSKSYASTYVEDEKNVTNEQLDRVYRQLLTYGTDMLTISYDVYDEDKDESYVLYVSIPAKDYQDFVNGKLTADDINKKFIVEA
ncbi:stalk domain-containing protein [Paenibacillus sp. GCM10012307]|uniref:Copper amine oxidase-like N-terminal domain-containing protein n=1 Tax=Paenibacillus roseus TaxID=2798579 RepID=A0A934MJY7_9BACL|nr:stalk domain-containing protein [Paenibacillus roseus]MBJ6360445.1 hypothetical protein [Paenibacillus roseus]